MNLGRARSLLQMAKERKKKKVPKPLANQTSTWTRAAG